MICRYLTLNLTWPLTLQVLTVVVKMKRRQDNMFMTMKKRRLLTATVSFTSCSVLAPCMLWWPWPTGTGMYRGHHFMICLWPFSVMTLTNWLEGITFVVMLFRSLNYMMTLTNWLEGITLVVMLFRSLNDMITLTKWFYNWYVYGAAPLIFSWVQLQYV